MVKLLSNNTNLVKNTYLYAINHIKNSKQMDAIKTNAAIFSIGETETIKLKTGTEFIKRGFIIAITTGPNGEYTEHLPLEIVGAEKVVYLDKYKAGDIVNVSFSLRGKLYNSGETQKAFLTARCFYIDKIDASVASPASNDAAPFVAQKLPKSKEDDLPF